MKTTNHYISKEINTLKIWGDLEEVSKIEEIRIDPVGNTIYLYFLLKNRKRGYEIDTLIDLINEWINEIINKENISRALDVEITSALLGYRVLKKYNKLKTNIKADKVNYILSKYIENNHFFDNFILSTIIGYSIIDIKENIVFFSDLVTWIKNQIIKRNVLSDGKNLIFSYLFLKELMDKELIELIFKLSYQLFNDADILFSDELYYSYILWNNRTLNKDKTILKKIRQFTEESIKNAEEYIRRTDSTEISKIYKGVLLDLTNEYEKTTIKVAKEEVTLDELDRKVLIAPLFSMLMLYLGCYIGNLMRLGYIDTFILPLLGNFGSDKTIIAALHGLTFIVIFSMYLIAFSLLWDILYKKNVRMEIITKNLIDRFKNRILEALIVTPSVIISIIKWFYS